jgi:hypothetical protein
LLKTLSNLGKIGPSYSCFSAPDSSYRSGVVGWRKCPGGFEFDPIAEA